ncbi:DNA polymerase III subunit [Paludibacter jiangxiensis]|uniref:DNA polymerase-3 subunit delta n=1 Tax=Paludibacter jiangxiensis TaxID=681398 RepID=A0A170Z486_9BACT|nr:DNA polymerase III subunit [Paludibacter jiangxiensis]GAT62319.1 DNA polymerase-3 subunit delta' [Paludibacter jiangxiensis]
MFFSSIIGQEAIKQRLIAAVQEQRIPHALLLCGGEGIGKLPLAIAFAQYVCCEHRTATDSCGSCPSCVKFAKLAHPDLHFVFPIIKPEGKQSVVCDDFVAEFRNFVLEHPYGTVNEWINGIGSGKQGMIYEAESGEILRKLNLKTYESEYKVMIIWQPEKMNITCANKLLKILEEPPEKTLFLLVSEMPDMLLTTIQSRTQRINIPQIERASLEEALHRKFSLTPESAANVARIANGNYRKAEEMIESSDENQFNLEQFIFLMRTAYARKVKEMKQWSEMMSKIGRERQKSFFIYAQKMVRENFILNLHEEELNYLNNNEETFSQRFAPFINERNIESIMTDLAIAERHIEGNVQAKMVFFDLSLKFIVSLIKK